MKLKDLIDKKDIKNIKSNLKLRKKQENNPDNKKTLDIVSDGNGQDRPGAKV